MFASAFCLVLLVWTASALSQKAGCFKNCSPSAVLGWFAPLVVYCFVDLGVSALLFQPEGGTSLAERFSW